MNVTNGKSVRRHSGIAALAASAAIALAPAAQAQRVSINDVNDTVNLILQVLQANQGVFEIDQACALAGCFAGDAPGYPVTITAPGPYRLTSDLIGAAGANGIEISADDVSLDLNGFALVGVPGSSSGILGVGGRRGLTIHGGTVRDWPSRGLDLGATHQSHLHHLDVSNVGGDGIAVSDHNLIAHVRVRNAGADGIDAGNSNVIESVTVDQSGADGIHVDNLNAISNCTVDESARDGIDAGRHVLIAGCTVSDSGDVGIAAFGQDAVIRDCQVNDSGEGGIETRDNAIVERCSVDDSGESGIAVGRTSIVRGSTVRRSDWTGIVAGSGSLVSGNTVQLPNLDDLRPDPVGAIEADRGTRIVGNVVHDPQRDGIVPADDCDVRDNTVRGRVSTQFTGITLNFSVEGCRIDGNHITNFNRGIFVLSPGNFITGNSASKIGFIAFDIAAGNTTSGNTPF